MDVKQTIIVKVKYYEYEFDNMSEAVNFAKNCIEHGIDVDIDDVSAKIVFYNQEQEVKENE